MTKKFLSINKPNNMLCGPACLYYLSRFIYKQENVIIPNNLFWMADLALFAFESLNYDVILSCYDSKLYDDYLLQTYPYNFDGFTSLYSFTSTSNKEISYKKISIHCLKNYLKQGYYIILNVSSAIFNDDPSMSGGHFILLLDFTESYFKVANPTTHHIEFINVPKHTILNSCQNFGNWMLCIRKTTL